MTGLIMMIQRKDEIMIDKHYENEGSSWYCSNKVKKVITIRLSYDEINILKKLYPGKTISFAIRSLIHKFDKM